MHRQLQEGERHCCCAVQIIHIARPYTTTKTQQQVFTYELCVPALD